MFIHLLTVPQFLKTSNPISCYQIGDYVVKQNNSYFPGEIIAVLDESDQVKVMTQIGTQYWKCSDKYDVLLYRWCNVMKKIDPPVIVSNRVTFGVEDMEYSQQMCV